MPIEIRELHIKVAVNTAQPPGAASTGAAAQSPAGGAASGGASSEELIAECVEKVLQVLHERSER